MSPNSLLPSVLSINVQNDKSETGLGAGEDAKDPMSGGRLAVMPTGESVITPPAQFRMLLISFLAAGIGLIAGCIAFLLYKLIGLFTNIFFFHRFAADFSSGRLQPSWAVGNRDAGDRRHHCWFHGQVWLAKNQRPWNS